MSPESSSSVVDKPRYAVPKSSYDSVASRFSKPTSSNADSTPKADGVTVDVDSVRIPEDSRSKEKPLDSVEAILPDVEAEVQQSRNRLKEVIEQLKSLANAGADAVGSNGPKVAEFGLNVLGSTSITSIALLAKRGFDFVKGLLQKKDPAAAQVGQKNPFLDTASARSEEYNSVEKEKENPMRVELVKKALMVTMLNDLQAKFIKKAPQAFADSPELQSEIINRAQAMMSVLFEQEPLASQATVSQEQFAVLGQASQEVVNSISELWHVESKPSEVVNRDEYLSHESPTIYELQQVEPVVEELIKVQKQIQEIESQIGEIDSFVKARQGTDNAVTVKAEKREQKKALTQQLTELKSHEELLTTQMFGDNGYGSKFINNSLLIPQASAKQSELIQTNTSVIRSLQNIQSQYEDFNSEEYKQITQQIEATQKAKDELEKSVTLQDSITSWDGKNAEVFQAILLQIKEGEQSRITKMFDKIESDYRIRPKSTKEAFEFLGKGLYTVEQQDEIVANRQEVLDSEVKLGVAHQQIGSLEVQAKELDRQIIQALLEADNESDDAYAQVRELEAQRDDCEKQIKKLQELVVQTEQKITELAEKSKVLPISSEEIESRQMKFLEELFGDKFERMVDHTLTTNSAKFNEFYSRIVGQLENPPAPSQLDSTIKTSDLLKKPVDVASQSEVALELEPSHVYWVTNADNSNGVEFEMRDGNIYLLTSDEAKPLENDKITRIQALHVEFEVRDGKLLVRNTATDDTELKIKVYPQKEPQPEFVTQTSRERGDAARQIALNHVEDIFSQLRKLPNVPMDLSQLYGNIDKSFKERKMKLMTDREKAIIMSEMMNLLISKGVEFIDDTFEFKIDKVESNDTSIVLYSNGSYIGTFDKPAEFDKAKEHGISLTYHQNTNNSDESILAA